MLAEPGLDDAHFNAVATQLHLMIQAAQMLDGAVCPITSQVARLVESGIGLCAEGMGDKAFGGQLRAVQVATRQAFSSNVEFARYTDGYQLQLRIEEVHLGVG